MNVHFFQLCQDDSTSLLCYLIPDIYKAFQNIALSNAQLMYLVVSTIDFYQLQELLCEIMQGQLKMVKRESFSSLVNSSLEWESLEQNFFWQMVDAHDFPIDHLLPILMRLNFHDHAEAMTAFLQRLKYEQYVFTYCT